MSAIPAGPNECRALLNDWIAQTPPQFLAFHALCKNLARRLLDPSDQQALAEVSRLADLFAAIRSLVDTIQGARSSVEEVRAAAVAAEPEVRKTMVTWAANHLGIVSSLGRTATQAEQVRAGMSQVQDMQREAILRLAVLKLLARTENLPAGESEPTKWRDLIIAGNLVRAVQEMETALAVPIPEPPVAPKPVPAATRLISSVPELPPKAPAAEASPPPASPPPDLATATDDLYALLHQCEVFAKALPELGAQLVVFRERERDLHARSSPDARQVRQLSEDLSKLLDSFREEAEKERAARLKALKRLQEWTEKLFAESFTGAASLESMGSAPVRTAREILAFRKQANQFESEILAFASSEPSALVSAVRERIETCRGSVQTLRGLPLREEIERQLREIEAEIPPQSDYAPVAAECFERCEACENLRQQLEKLIRIARSEWESLLGTFRSLEAREREARDFSAIVLSSDERADLPNAPAIVPDPQTPLPETTDRIHRFAAIVEQLEQRVETAARSQWEALHAQCVALFERIPTHSSALPQPPVAARSWTRWNQSLAEVEELSGLLEDQFVTETRNLEVRAREARSRLQKLVSNPRWRYSPDFRAAAELQKRLEDLPPLAPPIGFEAFDAVSEEVDVAETLLLRLEGAEYHVRDEAAKLERRLATLVDGGITHNRASIVRRATALVEGLSLAIQQGDAHWHQLAYQCKMIDQLLGSLETDQVQLASGWMEARMAEMERLLEQTPAGPMRDRLVNLLNDVRRAGHESLPSRVLRRRLLATLGSRGGEDGA